MVAIEAIHLGSACKLAFINTPKNRQIAHWRDSQAMDFMGLPSAAQVSRAQFHVDCDQSRIRQTNLRFYAMKRIKPWAQFGSTRAGNF
jgi:hypothetical protein